MERIDDLLRPPNGKGGNDHLAAALQSLAHELAHLSIGVGPGRMLPRSVSAFHLQIIHICDRLGIAQNIIISSSNITAEKVTVLPPIFRNIQHDLSRT